MLTHEQLQLVVQYLPLPHTIHQPVKLEKLWATTPQPAEAAPDHDHGWVLDPLPGKLGDKTISAI
jgi:hypothetical protein